MGPRAPQPLITLLVITDGRRTCLERTLASFEAATTASHITRRVIVNDCAENPQHDWIDSLGFDIHVRPKRHRRGFAGAINAGWAAANINPTDHIFHLEDDFFFTRYVDLRAMAEILTQHKLAQIALRRQPWNELEAAAGGVIELNPAAYIDRSNGAHQWLEHRLFFTTNPSLYPRWITERGWPDGPESEGRFSLDLFTDPKVQCAYWGQRTDQPWVMHIGNQRVGSGY